MKKSIAIIGGGPSALLTAAFLNINKFDVTIYEKKKSLGRKFLVAGDGGFNLSHGEPIEGWDNVRKALTQYRDAIQYVHDQTVIGMNQGKDVYTLMRDIRLPKALNVGEGYGLVSWSVRGIYEGYMGWFDGQPVSMYAEAPESIYPDLVAIAGGADKVVDKAKSLLADGEQIKALRLTEAALRAEPKHTGALKLRLATLTALRKSSSNLNESGWLNFGIKRTQQRLDKITADQ